MSSSTISTWVDKEHLTKKRGTPNVKVEMDKCVPIAAFRCSSCRYLEFYARSEFSLSRETSNGEIKRDFQAVWWWERVGS